MIPKTTDITFAEPSPTLPSPVKESEDTNENVFAHTTPDFTTLDRALDDNRVEAHYFINGTQHNLPKYMTMTDTTQAHQENTSSTLCRTSPRKLPKTSKDKVTAVLTSASGCGSTSA